MTVRGMQADDPAVIPPQPGQPGSRLLESPEESSRRQLAQIAGALGALARKVDTMDRPAVTIADRRAALTTALEFAAELGLGRPLSVPELVSVARYLTGE